VLHLDDLLLRRTRLGFAFADGGSARLPSLRALLQPELGWDDARWDAEYRSYAALWQREHAVPG
jgi:glycerol-3-phosphate dehydrogenase